MPTAAKILEQSDFICCPVTNEWFEKVLKLVLLNRFNLHT